jgi:hypothetical protein
MPVEADIIPFNGRDEENKNINYSQDLRFYNTLRNGILISSCL